VRSGQQSSQQFGAGGSGPSAVNDAASPCHDELVEALAAAQAQVQNLQTALQTARCIGMAVGILMAQHGMTSEQAFGLLRKASQQQHRKVRDLAEAVVYTGALPRRPGAAARST
jgi:hypothetical protein